MLVPKCGEEIGFAEGVEGVKGPERVDPGKHHAVGEQVLQLGHDGAFAALDEDALRGGTHPLVGMQEGVREFLAGGLQEIRRVVVARGLVLHAPDPAGGGVHDVK